MPDQISDRAPNSNPSASIFGLDPERISPYVLGILIVYLISEAEGRRVPLETPK